MDRAVVSHLPQHPKSQRLIGGERGALEKKRVLKEGSGTRKAEK